MSKSKLTKRQLKQLQQDCDYYLNERRAQGVHYEHYRNLEKALKEILRLRAENIMLTSKLACIPDVRMPPKVVPQDQLKRITKTAVQIQKRRW